MIHRIILTHLQEASLKRPPGYSEDVISRGKIEGGVLVIDDFNYRELCDKYGGPYRVPVARLAQDGPGTELKKLISKFGLHPAPNCKCSQHINEMNQKGIEWCSQNIDTIVGWLREEAQRAKLPFTEIGAKILVKRAIHNAKKKLTPAATA